MRGITARVATLLATSLAAGFALAGITTGQSGFLGTEAATG